MHKVQHKKRMKKKEYLTLLSILNSLKGTHLYEQSLVMVD